MLNTSWYSEEEPFPLLSAFMGNGATNYHFKQIKNWWMKALWRLDVTWIWRWCIGHETQPTKAVLIHHFCKVSLRIFLPFSSCSYFLLCLCLLCQCIKNFHVLFTSFFLSYFYFLKKESLIPYTSKFSSMFTWSYHNDGKVFSSLCSWPVAWKWKCTMN